MVLFEIWSVGKKPFSELSNKEAINLIDTGYNQPPPPGCPRAIYQLMVDCWYKINLCPQFHIFTTLHSQTSLILHMQY